MSDPIYLQLTCANCRYFLDRKRPQSEYGECHRRAPHLGWSCTLPTDWCGEHEPQVTPGKQGMWKILPPATTITNLKVYPGYIAGRFDETPPEAP